MDFTRRLCQAPAGHFANNLISLNPEATFKGWPSPPPWAGILC